MTPAPKDSQMSLGTFSLWDIALTIAEVEAQEWGDEAAMNLFLEPSLTMVRREVEQMAAQCGERTGERARVYVLAGRWSAVLSDAAHYENLARLADIWIFGAPDCDLSLNGIVAVPVPNGAALLDERGVVVESASFGAALFAHSEGLLNPTDSTSSYYEGFLTTYAEAVDAAAGRLASLLRLAPMTGRWVDHDLMASWYARTNRRIMEVLESQRLQLRAREEEIEKMREESARMERLVRGYVGGQTWDAAQSALRSNQEEIADLERQEFTICFCDLVGFTKLSERLTPTQVAGILNDHFGRLYNIVKVHGGTIDKFIGDCMLAYFTEPVEAFEASKKMVQESREVRPNRQLGGADSGARRSQHRVRGGRQSGRARNFASAQFWAKPSTSPSACRAPRRRILSCSPTAPSRICQPPLFAISTRLKSTSKAASNRFRLIAGRLRATAARRCTRRCRCAAACFRLANAAAWRIVCVAINNCRGAQSPHSETNRFQNRLTRPNPSRLNFVHHAN